MNIDTLEKMLAKGNDSAMLRFGLGKAYLDNKKPDEAITHLQHCVEQDPDYSAAWNLLGKAHLQLGDKASAEIVWQSGLDVAVRKGDKQTEKEITVFLKKLKK
ncbi:tetratricopeptide repeat protein [Zhongshania sp.]|jgi:predicted Zn-dependent protease|uniref:tetratricopeptide repeat protein n=1 Tax=Zhongshania sp. TaxID=1971902 RepID=UPI001B3E29B6|nr:tetratricopeptide repeat protein [Zhongshania sp.]MBQ0796381.1 tetratricopeptide repeat protein [Zhongshania sp.]